eukprot:scaffold1237_cov243-Pinguiococcus_pyrenoidosus.AAC.8
MDFYFSSTISNGISSDIRSHLRAKSGNVAPGSSGLRSKLRNESRQWRLPHQGVAQARDWPSVCCGALQLQATMGCRQTKDYLVEAPCDWPWLPKNDNWTTSPLCTVLAAERSVELQPNIETRRTLCFAMIFIASLLFLARLCYLLYKSAGLREFLQRRSNQKLIGITMGCVSLAVFYFDPMGERGYVNLVFAYMCLGFTSVFMSFFYLLCATDLKRMMGAMQSTEEVPLSMLEGGMLTLGTIEAICTAGCLVIRPSDASFGVSHSYVSFVVSLRVFYQWLIVGASFVHSRGREESHRKAVDFQPCRQGRHDGAAFPAGYGEPNNRRSERTGRREKDASHAEEGANSGHWHVHAGLHAATPATVVADTETGLLEVEEAIWQTARAHRHFVGCAIRPGVGLSLLVAAEDVHLAGAAAELAPMYAAFQLEAQVTDANAEGQKKAKRYVPHKALHKSEEHLAPIQSKTDEEALLVPYPEAVMGVPTRQLSDSVLARSTWRAIDRLRPHLARCPIAHCFGSTKCATNWKIWPTEVVDDGKARRMQRFVEAWLAKLDERMEKLVDARDLFLSQLAREHAQGSPEDPAKQQIRAIRRKLALTAGRCSSLAQCAR